MIFPEICHDKTSQKTKYLHNYHYNLINSNTGDKINELAKLEYIHNDPEVQIN